MNELRFSGRRHHHPRPFFISAGHHWQVVPLHRWRDSGVTLRLDFPLQVGE